ncbi:MAG: LLM class F420-dependent oxidoreductase [bacterium]|nr:LLM class F420-dependent oxidoreductase [Candidatus Binatota bacterium]
MKFGVMFSNVGPMGTPDFLPDFARLNEAAGMESLWTVEHVVVPSGYKSTYPYSGDGRMPGAEESPIPDPILPLVYAAAVTEKIKLATGVLILPQRHPFYVAKEIATLDVLSRGRAILGIGVGWLEEEFDALGISFADRASRTREAVAAIRSLWKAEPEAFDGKFFNWGPMHSSPGPVQAAGVPVVVGGHTPIAAKRAARYGDGFFPAVGGPEQLEPLLLVLKEECDKLGRDAGEVEISVGMGDCDLDTALRLQDMGVSRAVIAPRGFDSGSLEKGLAIFDDKVMSRL